MNVTSDWLLSHCSKLPCTHFLRELSTLPETDENEERGKTELVEIQESCEQFSGRSSSPTVSVQNWSLTLWNKRANQISVNRGFVNLSCSHQKYCQNLKLKIILSRTDIEIFNRQLFCIMQYAVRYVTHSLSPCTTESSTPGQTGCKSTLTTQVHQKWDDFSKQIFIFVLIINCDFC